MDDEKDQNQAPKEPLRSINLMCPANEEEWQILRETIAKLESMVERYPHLHLHIEDLQEVMAKAPS